MLLNVKQFVSIRALLLRLQCIVHSAFVLAARRRKIKDEIVLNKNDNSKSCELSKRKYLQYEKLYLIVSLCKNNRKQNRK